MKSRLLLSAVAVWALFCVPAFAAPDEAFDRGTPLGAIAAPSAPETVQPSAVELDPRVWVEVEADSRQERNIVADAGISIEEVAPDKVAGYALPESLRELRAKGLSFKVLELGQKFTGLDFPSEDAAFHNYDELKAGLEELAAKAPDLVSLFPIGAGFQGKRQILALRINSAAKGTEPSTRPGIVFMGTHHAREHLSTEVPFLLAKHLIENRAKPEIAGLLANRDIHIIPMVNPDGVEFDVSGGRYHMHRKNMRPNSDGSVGVDLNRNYGFHWGEGGASDNPRSDTYRGEKPFSEPETQAIRDFVEARKNLKILLSFHTFSELILYPWGHSNDPIPDTQALSAYKAMAQTMAGMNGYTPQQSSDLYIASGDTTDWAWGTHKIFSFTFELTPKSMWNGGFYPGAGAINGTFAANLRPALYLIGLAEDPYKAGAPAVTRAARPHNPGGR